MAFIIVPILGFLLAFAFSRIGIRIILAVVLIVSTAWVLLIATMTLYSIFLPDHLEHLTQILDRQYENPQHPLRDFFADFFPWSY